MGLFEELTVPARFNRLRKYFLGLDMYDLDPAYPYTELVETKDKLLMLVFCNKYICTPDHKYIRRVLDQDDLGEENLEETIRVFEILVKTRSEQIEELQRKLDDEINAKNDLQYEHNSLVNMVKEMCGHFGSYIADGDHDEKKLRQTLQDVWNLNSCIKKKYEMYSIIEGKTTTPEPQI